MLSVVFCLRISDAATVTLAGIGVPGQFTFWDCKVNKCMATYPLSDYMDNLRAAVCRLRRADHADDAPIVPVGTTILRALWQEFTKNTCVQGKGWHTLKRMGAAAFRAMGGSLYGLQIWARWHSLAMPRLYSGHLATWVWSKKAILPDPTSDPSGRGRLMERTHTDTHDLWPKQAVRKPKQPTMVRNEFPRETPEVYESPTDDDADVVDQVEEQGGVEDRQPASGGKGGPVGPQRCPDERGEEGDAGREPQSTAQEEVRTVIIADSPDAGQRGGGGRDPGDHAAESVRSTNPERQSSRFVRNLFEQLDHQRDGAEAAEAAGADGTFAYGDDPEGSDVSTEYDPGGEQREHKPDSDDDNGSARGLFDSPMRSDTGDWSSATSGLHGPGGAHLVSKRGRSGHWTSSPEPAKYQVVAAMYGLPGSSGSGQPGAPVREDRAPHWGYEVSAPMFKDRRKLFRPRPVRLQQDGSRRAVPQLPECTAGPCRGDGTQVGGQAAGGGASGP